jgi:hypothetical protein
VPRLTYNPNVSRWLTAAALIVIVQTAAVAAPLLHVHLDDDATGHHHGQVLHAHFDGHDVGTPVRRGPLVDHQDETGRTIAAHIFVAAAAKGFAVPVAACASFMLLVPVARPIGHSPHVCHAHDPPALSLLSPRAPPAILI